MGSYRHGLAAILAAVIWALHGNAAARQVAKPMTPPLRVLLCGSGGEVDINLHPDLITTLDFPYPIGKTYAADTERFTFWVNGPRLHIRPTAEAKKYGQTSAEVIAGDHVIALRLRVIPNPDEVPLRWEFVIEQGRCSRAPPWVQALLARHLANLRKSSLLLLFQASRDSRDRFSEIGAPHSAQSRSFNPSPSSPSRTPNISIHLHATLGVAQVGDEIAEGRTVVVGTQGVHALLGYRTHRLYHYEVELAFTRLNRFQFSDITNGEDSGTLARQMLTGRVHASVRFDRKPSQASPLSRFSASLHLGAGAQWRQTFASRLIIGKAAVEGPPEVTNWDASVGLGVGVSYSITTKFSAGAGTFFTNGFPVGGGPGFRSLEATIHVGWESP